MVGGKRTSCCEGVAIEMLLAELTSNDMNLGPHSIARERSMCSWLARVEKFSKRQPILDLLRRTEYPRRDDARGREPHDHPRVGEFPATAKTLRSLVSS